MIFPLLVIECISPMGSRTWIVHPPRLGWVGFGWSLFLHPYVSLFSSCTVLLISCPCCPLNVARHPRFLPWIWPHGPRSPPSLSLLSQRTLPFYSSFLPSKPPLLSLTPPPLPPECVCERGVAVDRGRRGPPPLPPTNRGASGGVHLPGGHPSSRTESSPSSSGTSRRRRRRRRGRIRHGFVYVAQPQSQRRTDGSASLPPHEPARRQRARRRAAHQPRTQRNRQDARRRCRRCVERCRRRRRCERRCETEHVVAAKRGRKGWKKTWRKRKRSNTLPFQATLTDEERDETKPSGEENERNDESDGSESEEARKRGSDANVRDAIRGYRRQAHQGRERPAA